MKGRILALSLAAMMILTLGACGKSSKNFDKIGEAVAGEWGWEWSAMGVSGYSYYTFGEWNGSTGSATFTRVADGEIDYIMSGYYEIEEGKIVITKVSRLDWDTEEQSSYEASSTEEIAYTYKDGVLTLDGLERG